jgi:hypothetical protein
MNKGLTPGDTTVESRAFVRWHHVRQGVWLVCTSPLGFNSLGIRPARMRSAPGSGERVNVNVKRQDSASPG